MCSKARVLLLSCGSFNPITNMHLRMFELARDYLHSSGLYQVIGGIISPVNDAYGKKDLVSAKHRCEMVELALCSSDWIKLDCWESDQDCWVPTVRVLEHHQAILNTLTNTNNAANCSVKKQKLDVENLNSVNNNEQKNTWDLSQPVKIMLLCGADLLESFGVPDLWKDTDITQIVGKHGLVVITRNGSNPERFIYESDILSRLQSNIHIVTEWISNEISSTHIRRALRRGNSVKYLLQDSVLKYIKDHDLYTTSNIVHEYDGPHSAPRRKDLFSTVQIFRWVLRERSECRGKPDVPPGFGAGHDGVRDVANLKQEIEFYLLCSWCIKEIAD